MSVWLQETRSWRTTRAESRAARFAHRADMRSPDRVPGERGFVVAENPWSPSENISLFLLYAHFYLSVLPGTNLLTRQLTSWPEIEAGLDNHGPETDMTRANNALWFDSGAFRDWGSKELSSSNISEWEDEEAESGAQYSRKLVCSSSSSDNNDDCFQHLRAYTLSESPPPRATQYRAPKLFFVPFDMSASSSAAAASFMEVWICLLRCC